LSLASKQDDDESHSSTLSKSDVVLTFQLEVMKKAKRLHLPQKKLQHIFILGCCFGSKKSQDSPWNIYHLLHNASWK